MNVLNFYVFFVRLLRKAQICGILNTEKEHGTHALSRIRYAFPLPSAIPPRGERSKNMNIPAFRQGHGYDVHRLCENRALILGGVTIPYDRDGIPIGLLGHSDADVLVHAVMDAVLGAAALGDIGRHFPDTDMRYKGADSIALARETARLLGEAGYAVGNIDATVIAQKPKLAPYIETMRENIAAAYGIELSQVNVKATTEERLGFTGSGDGIAAHAVCLIYRL